MERVEDLGEKADFVSTVNIVIWQETGSEDVASALATLLTVENADDLKPHDYDIKPAFDTSSYTVDATHYSYSYRDTVKTTHTEYSYQYDQVYAPGLEQQHIKGGASAGKEGKQHENLKKRVPALLLALVLCLSLLPTEALAIPRELPLLPKVSDQAGTLARNCGDAGTRSLILSTSARCPIPRRSTSVPC